MLWRMAVLSFLFALVLHGCRADHSGDQIIDLQKQLSLLSRRVEEGRKEINALQDTDKSLRQSLDSAEAEINRLKALETLPPSAARGALEEEELSVTPVLMPTRRQPLTPAPREPFSIATIQQHKATISCPQVWALLGQGKNTAETAKALKTTIERVRSCEQQVGRGRAQ
jgi:TolA-binding protein